MIFLPDVQVRSAAATAAGRAVDALTGSACAGLQAELIQRLAFRLLGRRCRRSPAFRARLLAWVCAPWGAANTAALGRLRAGAPRRLFDRDLPQQRAEALLLAQLAAWQLRAMLPAAGAPAGEGLSTRAPARGGASAVGAQNVVSPAKQAAAGQGCGAGMPQSVPFSEAPAAVGAPDAGAAHDGESRAAPEAGAGEFPAAGMPHGWGAAAALDEAERSELIAAVSAWASQVAEVC